MLLSDLAPIGHDNFVGFFFWIIFLHFFSFFIFIFYFILLIIFLQFFSFFIFIFCFTNNISSVFQFFYFHFLFYFTFFIFTFFFFFWLAVMGHHRVLLSRTHVTVTSMIGIHYEMEEKTLILWLSLSNTYNNENTR